MPKCKESSKLCNGRCIKSTWNCRDKEKQNKKAIKEASGKKAVDLDEKVMPRANIVDEFQGSRDSKKTRAATVKTEKKSKSVAPKISELKSQKSVKPVMEPKEVLKPEDKRRLVPKHVGNSRIYYAGESLENGSFKDKQFLRDFDFDGYIEHLKQVGDKQIANIPLKNNSVRVPSKQTSVDVPIEDYKSWAQQSLADAETIWGMADDATKDAWAMVNKDRVISNSSEILTTITTDLAQRWQKIEEADRQSKRKKKTSETEQPELDDLFNNLGDDESDDPRSLEQLFIDAEKIGKKYQTPDNGLQEIKNKNNKIRLEEKLKNKLPVKPNPVDPNKLGTTAKNNRDRLKKTGLSFE